MSRIEPTDRGLAGALFTPLSWLYGAGVRARLALYGAGLLTSEKVEGVRVVGIGNLTVGGTGKTPVAIMLASMLEKPAIVSRGYGRASAEPVQVVNDGKGNVAPYPDAADEALVCAAALPAVPVICAPRRVEGIRAARGLFGAKTAILDDAFSHLAAARGKNILLVDALDPFGGEKLLPAGRLREPLSSARRADAVLITRANMADKDTVAGIRLRLAPLLRPDTPVFECAIAAESVVAPSGETLAADIILGGAAVTLVSGIAKPEQFEKTVKAFGADVARHHIFADHHRFTDAELEAVTGGLLLTTQKDAARMPEKQRRRFHLLTLRAAVREGAAFAAWLNINN
ncbi:MAG: tetraacyldisaccharide 4'-kinase [Nitrospinae bacterium]|nr:tetraacyldisaccharide 4'-kinase [Nitrospinota bacterium]